MFYLCNGQMPSGKDFRNTLIESDNMLDFLELLRSEGLTLDRIVAIFQDIPEMSDYPAYYFER
jgi:hypothetical protein